MTQTSGLDLGTIRFDDVPFAVVNVPVLEGLGLGNTCGLLGMDFLRRFELIEVDYDLEVLHLVPRRLDA